MMRATLMWFVLAFVCCGLARTAGGIHPRGSGDDKGLFIPTVDSAGNYKKSNSSRWQASPPTGGTKSRRTALASRKPTAAVPASDANAAWLPDLSRPWAVVLIALGGSAVVLVPALFVGRWIRASRARRTRGTDRFRPGLRSRSPVPTGLAASLVQMQLRNDEFAETGHEEQPKKIRRAA